MISGNVGKLLSLPIADSLGVSVNESEREQSGIIRKQFCGFLKVLEELTARQNAKGLR